MSRKKHKHERRQRPPMMNTTAAGATATNAARTPVDWPEGTPLNSFWLIGGGLLVLASVCWAYWPTLLEVFSTWRDQPDYSHGFLVAPLAILFLWLRRETFPSERIRPSAAGLVVLAVCCLARYAAGRYYFQPLDSWTIPLWIMGCVWTLFGWQVLRWSLPSIVFLWFMFPLPYSAETWLSVPLQALATRLSTASLVMLGLPALAEGNTIWIGEDQLFVEEACSGLRIFMGIFALAFAYVLFTRWPWWQKALALVAALPIAICANVLRIVGTGLLYRWVSNEAGRSFSHDFSGIVMIPLAAIFFWLFVKYLDRLFPEVELVSPVRR